MFQKTLRTLELRSEPVRIRRASLSWGALGIAGITSYYAVGSSVSIMCSAWCQGGITVVDSSGVESVIDGRFARQLRELLMANAL